MTAYIINIIRNIPAPMAYRLLTILFSICAIGISAAAAAPADSVAVSSDSAAAHSDSLQPSPTLRDTIRYEADIIEYDAQSRIILMRGNCIVRNKKMTLFADTINFVLHQDLLVASGYPQLFEGNDTVVGESMTYNIKTSRGRVKYGTAHSDGAKYVGRQLARSDDRNFYMCDGAYSSCEREDSAHYFFYSRDIKVLPGEKAVSRPVVLNIADAPILALPFFVIPLRQGRHSGFLRPVWGGNPSNGGYLDNLGYYWAPNDYTDYTLSSKIYEFSTYLLSGSGQYNLRNHFTGHIGASYSFSNADINDTRNNRWSIDYRHDQNLLPDGTFRLAGRGNIVSSKSYYGTFSEDSTQLLNQQIDANLALTKNFKKINAYSSAIWTRHHDFRTDAVTQDLPSLSFTLSPRPLIPVAEVLPGDTAKDTWYNRITWSWGIAANSRSVDTKTRTYTFDTAVATYRDSLAHLTRISSQKTTTHSGLGHNFSLSSSQTLFKWITISPSFTARQSVFDAWIDTSRRIQQRLSPVYDTLDHRPLGDTLVVDSIPASNGIDTAFFCRVGLITDTVYVQDTVSRGDPRFFYGNTQSWTWNAGVSLSTRLYGLFPLHLFGLAGIRHTLTPSVGYTYTPLMELDRRFPEVGVPTVYGSKRAQNVSFSLDNLFQGKTAAGDEGKPPEKKFNIVNARIGSSYNFEADDRKLADIGLSANTGIPFLDVSYNSSFRPYSRANTLEAPHLMQYTLSFRPKSISLAGSLWDGDRVALQTSVDTTGKKAQTWSFGMSPSYNFGKSRSEVGDDFTTRKDFSLSMNAALHFTKKWSANWGGYYNFGTNRLESNNINFLCDLECWDMKFNWRPSGYNPGFYFIVAIKKHPEIKWEEKKN